VLADRDVLARLLVAVSILGFARIAGNVLCAGRLLTAPLVGHGHLLILNLNGL